MAWVEEHLHTFGNSDIANWSLVIVSVDYKFVSVNNEFHNITLSGTIEVLVLASAVFQ